MTVVPPARALRVKRPGRVPLVATCQNVHVITRYNHSHLYALAVNEMTGQLRQGRLKEPTTQHEYEPEIP
ncbi:MAG: lytic murein transglycosylase [Pseudomonadota bacterium]